MAQIAETSSGQRTEPGFLRATFRQFWQALLLQPEAYQPILGSERPVRQGFRMLTALYLITGLITSLGLIFHYLTLPKVELIQSQVGELIFNSGLYQQWTAEQPALAAVLNLGYRLFWFIAGIRIGYPSRLDIFLTPLSLWVMGLFNWVTFAIFGELIGRKLGGQARRRAFWGALAVANAPQLLTVLNVIPGLVVPSGLLWSWTILTSYQATHATYPQLNWRRTLSTTLLMYALHYFFIFLSIVLGVLLGVLIYSLVL
ncbi:MAG: hypothetical protein MUO23_12655 [Anaerolineales bacterium]|nr:hypothetical protein [Anaerolineales bacterium]